MNRKGYYKFLMGLQEEWPAAILPEIKRYVGMLDHKLIAVDDDPTGSQLVKDIAVLSEWDVDILVRELQSPLKAFYITTNTRGKNPDEAEAINFEIGKNLRLAAEQVNKRISIISRGDSTLRGHFPGETEALQRGLGLDPDGTFLIPALLDDGRLTINDVHYVVKNGWLVPVGQTDYAKDASFGYASSNLREWVEEKTQGRIQKEDVHSISLNELRSKGPDFILRKILGLPKGFICIVNAVSRKDIEVFTLAMVQAELIGRQFMTRSGPSFVPVRMGLEEYPLMRRDDLPGLDRSAGGLTIVGSYVANSSRQIEEVLRRNLVKTIVMEVDKIIDERCREKTIRTIAESIDRELGSGQDVMLYTSRRLIVGGDAISSLQIGFKVSSSLIEVLRSLQTRPRYILAKGGITSSDLATQGLGVKRAMILGQIEKGISVWALGPETKFNGLYYLVFPGNVGNADTLAKVITELAR
ncbi:MAG: hypothetical protein MUC85_09560 [Anaerolineales bacterium]|jgi:uncharacterized protein YgbK (DUF1537 family)|nr:hypothetical protein [Anaerolineales bacterium]